MTLDLIFYNHCSFLRDTYLYLATCIKLFASTNIRKPQLHTHLGVSCFLFSSCMVHFPLKFLLQHHPRQKVQSYDFYLHVVYTFRCLYILWVASFKSCIWRIVWFFLFSTVFLNIKAKLEIVSDPVILFYLHLMITWRILVKAIKQKCCYFNVMDKNSFAVLASFQNTVTKHAMLKIFMP